MIFTGEKENLALAKKDLQAKGFLDVQVPASIDYLEEINKLRKEKNAVILAHYYQDSVLQEIADYVGDSLQLSQNAAKTDADIIVFAGVYFMGETAKILSPQKKVLVPDLHAGCSLVDSCPVDEFKKFKEQYPDHVVVTYVNSSAELKAVSDIICTSANAVKIIKSIPKDQPIIFCPDENLGRYLIRETGRDMLLWHGACVVHEVFSLEKIKEMKEKYPNAKFIAHPECKEVVLMMADFVGSTSAMLKYTIDNPAEEFVVITEEGVIHQMKKASPHKTFIPGPPILNAACACSECSFMKMNTLKKLYLALKYEEPEVTVPEEIRVKALKPIQRMLELS